MEGMKLGRVEKASGKKEKNRGSLKLSRARSISLSLKGVSHDVRA